MAAVSHYAPVQPPIGPTAASNSIFGPPQRSNSPAVGGRRKVAVPAKAPPVVVPAPTPKITGDVFYGYEDLSKMCGRFIGALFSCPNVPMFLNGSIPGNGSAPCPPLAHFIAYAIHRTRLPEVVVFTALFLLARLKERFPAARGSSGHRLFISAFMIASKVICDDTYSNKSWCIVGQNLYTLKEVNQMEREMCSYLEWLLHVEAPELESFTQRVKKEYGAECGPNPPQWVSTPAAVAPLAATIPITPVESVAPRQAAIAPTQSYPSPTSSPPTPSRSNQSSPETSDEECLTPPSGDDQVAIAHASTTHTSSSMMNTDTTLKAKPISSISHPLSSTDPSFAFAGPTVW